MTGSRGSGDAAGAPSAKQETAIDATKATEIDRTMMKDICWLDVLCTWKGYMSSIDQV